MTDRHDLLSRMREALADLYDDQRSAGRMADDAGLDAARIERADRAVNYWHSILREAERQGKMDALLALAVKEYPARTDLADLRGRVSHPERSEEGTATHSTGAGASAATRADDRARTAAGAEGGVAVAGSRPGGCGGRGRAGHQSRHARNATPTKTTAVTVAVTRTLNPPAAGHATDLPVAAPIPSPAPATAPQAVFPACFEGYFGGIADARVTTLEPGTNDFDLPTVDLTQSEPIGFMFTRDEQPLGAMRFRFVKANQFFRIEGIVDSRCEKIEGYVNASRGGDKNVLQQWDTLQLTLGNQSYALGMGIWAPEESPDKGLIRVDFGETAPP